MDRGPGPVGHVGNAFFEQLFGNLVILRSHKLSRDLRLLVSYFQDLGSGKSLIRLRLQGSGLRVYVWGFQLINQG